MGFFSKTLQAAMPKMIGNPITTAVAMVSVALSVVKGKKATKATKNKKKATVKKSKIVSKKQKKQMEVMERVCQSAYGIYIRGVTTVTARYIGHPAVAIPASQMIKTMMEEAAPTVNYLVQLETGSKQGSNIKEEKKPRIDKHTSGRFEYLKGCTNGWYTGFTKAIKGEQVIDEKYTLENLFSGNLTVEDMPDLPEYMTMVGAVIGAKYRGLWNNAKGTFDGVKMLVTEPEKVLEVASDAILDFVEDPWENTKELAGNIRDSVVDAVWKSTPQEISEDAGEILGDVLTAVATGGGGKAAASGAKIAGNKLLALGKTGAKEFAEGLGSYGKWKVATAGGIPVKNTVKNMTKFPAKILMSNADDAGKSAANVTKGIASKTDDAMKIAANSEKSVVSSTTKELVDNAVKGTPIVEASKKAGKKAKNEVADNVANKTEKKAIQEAAENKVVKGESGKGKGDGVNTSPAVNENNIESIKKNTQKVNPKLLKSSEDISKKAKKGNLKCAKNYHGRLNKELEQEILSSPDAVYVTNNSKQNFVYRKGGNVVIVESQGSSKGNIITSYGPGGPRGESGAAIFGGKPTDPGMPVTHEDILNGIKQPGGGVFPPATQIR